MRRVLPWIVLPLALFGCDPDVITSEYQAYSVRLYGPDVPPNTAADPFNVVKDFKVTLNAWEDAAGTVPYASTQKELPDEFEGFKPTFEYKFSGAKTLFNFDQGGQPLWVPRLGENQLNVYISAEVLGLDDKGKAIARARCTPRLLLPRTSSKVATVECKAFFGFIGRWNPIKAPARPRHSFAAAALSDGRFLVAGGLPSNPEVTAPYTQVELYDPEQKNTDGTLGAWRELGPLGTARSELTATRTLGGSIIFAGGKTGETTFSSTVDVYDAGSDAMKRSTQLTTPRAEHGAGLLLGETIVLIGGKSSPQSQISAPERLSTSGAPQSLSASVRDRNHPCVVAIDTNKLLICGGGQKSCETFDGVASQFHEAGASDFTRNDVKCAFVGDAAFLVGGIADVAQTGIEQWKDGVVTSFAGAPRSLTNHALAVANGKVVVSGGYLAGTTTALKSGYWFDPKLPQDGVHDLSGGTLDMKVARANHSMIGLADGTVVAIGGQVQPGDPVAPGAEVFVVPDSP